MHPPQHPAATTSPAFRQQCPLLHTTGTAWQIRLDFQSHPSISAFCAWLTPLQLSPFMPLDPSRLPQSVSGLLEKGETSSKPKSSMCGASMLCTCYDWEECPMFCQHGWQLLYTYNGRQA